MLEINHVAEARVIHVLGDIDLITNERLSATIDEVALGGPYVIVDFTDCPYVDSSCLNVLVRQRRKLGDRLGVVVPAASSIRRIFAICELDTYLEVADTVTALLDRDAT